jgi:hypothetical protein
MARPKRFSWYVYCRECLRTTYVHYVATWDDPIIRRIAIAKAGWVARFGVEAYTCPECAAKDDQ